jgi:hypothetical protein
MVRATQPGELRARPILTSRMPEVLLGTVVAIGSASFHRPDAPRRAAYWSPEWTSCLQLSMMWICA